MADYGSLAVELHRESDSKSSTLHILQADPRIRVAGDLLDDARTDTWGGLLVLDGDVLTIRDDYGQRFIYRIRWDDYADGGYLAEWPD